TEADTGDGRHLFGEQVYECGGKENHGDDAQADWDLHAGNVNVPRHLPLALAWAAIAQHDHRQRHEREAPDHAEGIQRGQQVNVAAAGDDGQYLQPDDHVDDAIAGAEAGMRFLEPGGEDAVLDHAVQHAVGAYDGCVNRT